MPAQSLDIPKRLPLVIDPQNRDDSTQKDARLVNCYLERRTANGEQEVWVYGRPGMLEASRPPGANAAGAGLFNWTGDIYSVFGATLYKNGTSVGTVNSSGGVYKFDSCLGATPRLQLGNGLAAYNYSSGTGLLQITDPDFPATFYKGWAYLNGTTYVMKPSATIQGSDINAPDVWDGLNFILAQITPDAGRGLAKQLVYVVAFKQTSTEIFYDAGNAAGSPLGSVQGAFVPFGCLNIDSVQDIDGSLVWAGSTRQASPQVWLMENLKASRVSTAPVEKLIERADFSAGNVFSWSLKIDGHKFYVLTLKTENLTLAYDINEQFWAQWTDSSGNYVPIVASCTDSSLRHILQHETNGRLYYCGAEYYTDAGAAIVHDIYPPAFDGGTLNIKTLPVMTFVADVVQGSALKVRSNDLDYTQGAWSNFRTVDLSQIRPQLTENGSFRRRAWHFRHDLPTWFRIKAVELRMDIGSL